MGEMEGAFRGFSSFLFYLHLLHSHFAFFEVEGSAEARGAHPANHDVAQELGLKILGRGSTLRFDGGVETTQVAETHTLAVEQGFDRQQWLYWSVKSCRRGWRNSSEFAQLLGRSTSHFCQ